ncbi:MAG: ROK family glucokinase [Frankiaceae bacterium]
MTLTIGVDVGGTNVRAGVVDDSGCIIHRVQRSTPVANREAVLASIAEAIRECSAAHAVAIAGVAVAGFVDAAGTRLIFAANLPLREEPLKAELESRTGLRVLVENDANAAAWGEYRFGGGHGDDMVCVTVGTGVGGGIVLGGRLVRGRWGFAAEIGHLRMVPGGLPCGCGRRGCLEQYASGQALVREARHRAAEDRSAAGRLLALGDGTPEGVQGPHVTEAARLGDPVAVAAFHSIGTWLGEGLAQLAAVLDPASFVVGGGVSAAGDVLLAPARVAYAGALTAVEHRPPAEIRLAELGNDAGLVGAADLARS